MKKGYVGWEVPDMERFRLMGLIPPEYPTTIIHHVTLAFGVDESYPLPLKLPAFILGVANDCNGLQAAVVEIGGTSARPDGSVFHITWSLSPGRKPKESNDLVKNWPNIEPNMTHFDPSKQTIFYTPEPIALEPRFFPF